MCYSIFEAFELTPSGVEGASKPNFPRWQIWLLSLGFTNFKGFLRPPITKANFNNAFLITRKNFQKSRG